MLILISTIFSHLGGSTKVCLLNAHTSVPSWKMTVGMDLCSDDHRQTITDPEHEADPPTHGHPEGVVERLRGVEGRERQKCANLTVVQMTQALSSRGEAPPELTANR